MQQQPVKETAAEESKPANIYGITVTTSRLFKKQMAKPGHIYFIARWERKFIKHSEAYLVKIQNIKLHGEEAIKANVIEQVINRNLKDGKEAAGAQGAA